jgi:hypothetical protein
LTWSRLAARWTAALALCACIAAPALADPKDKPKKSKVPLRVMVTRLSNDGRGIDPGARDLENKLSNQGIRYDSAQVLEKKRMQLQMNEVGTIDLPNGRKARVRPMHRSEDGVLMAVDVDGASKADVRAKPNHTVIFSAGPYEDGKLVLSVEPEQAPEP